MRAKDLSILIPARNEMFLKWTVESLLVGTEADTEIFVGLDGQWSDPPIIDDERVTLFYMPESIGQRAMTNQLARMSRARYVMKMDAHCKVPEGFDVAMLEAYKELDDEVTMVPNMKNLHVFDWVCTECGKRRYQGKSGAPEAGRGIHPDDKGVCPECGGVEDMDIVWKEKRSPNSTAMRFDKNLKFQYWGGLKKRQKGDLVETMSLIGACWMVNRERYWELTMCDEKHGSWGQQGTEVACRTWLSGGRLICNKRTWFAHMFRTQGGDFGFPYPLSGGAVSRARKYSKQLWMPDGNPDNMPAWDKAVRPLSWLIDHFKPIPDWHTPDPKKKGKVEPESEVKSERKLSEEPKEEIPTIIKRDHPRKGIVYYTHNKLDAEIMAACQRQLLKARLPIISVSHQPLDFGLNIVIDLDEWGIKKPGPEALFRQILLGMEAAKRAGIDIVFQCEHDILYHPSHFEFTPERKDTPYYNNNLWKVAWELLDKGKYKIEEGTALYHKSNHLSQVCGWMDMMLTHYTRRMSLIEKHGFSRRMGFEMGTHGRAEKVDDLKCDIWYSPTPNIDIRHKKNLTSSRWRIEEFRNKRFTEGWDLRDDENAEVPGWGKTWHRFQEMVREV